MNNFLQKENLTMLWDVVSDENIFKFLSKNIQNKVSDVFLSNIKGFYENEKSKTTNFMDMNKKYILLILNYIKQNYPQELPNKITILKEDTEPITYEEIHNEKISEFEKNLKLKQDEFEGSIKLKVPEKPNFSDKLDQPIGEMDKMIKEITAKRNYDVEEINRYYKDTSTQHVNNWLKPQETSLKSEKLQINTQVNEEIKQTKSKHVQWSDNNIELKINEDANELQENQDIEEQNIFSKLKKINNNSDNNSDNILDEKIKQLENKFDMLNNKLERIIELINK